MEASESDPITLAEVRRQIIEGCQEMSAIYLEIDREWAAISDEVWRAAE